GDGATLSSDQPAPADAFGDAVSVAAAYEDSFAVQADGTIVATGSARWGMLGNGDTKKRHQREVPAPVPGLGAASTVAAPHAQALGLVADGTVMAWGHGSKGVLGDGSSKQQAIPVKVTGLGEVAAVTTGESTSLALLRNGTVMAWGSNQHGQLGTGAKQRGSR